MSRDLRAYSRQTIMRLLVGFLILVFIVGDGLIYLIYGREAALTGLLCLTIALSPLVIIWIALSVMEWIAKRAQEE
jgi:TM2 domain-containing membrane protein YozV